MIEIIPFWLTIMKQMTAINFLMHEELKDDSNKLHEELKDDSNKLREELKNCMQ